MQYKTIVLELLRQRTELHERLRQARRLRPTMEALATELRNLHLDWQASLSQARPGSDPSQIGSEALELALKDLEDYLPSASRPTGEEQPPFSGSTANPGTPMSED